MGVEMLEKWLRCLVLASSVFAPEEEEEKGGEKGEKGENLKKARKPVGDGESPSVGSCLSGDVKVISRRSEVSPFKPTSCGGGVRNSRTAVAMGPMILLRIAPSFSNDMLIPPLCSLSSKGEQVIVVDIAGGNCIASPQKVPVCDKGRLVAESAFFNEYISLVTFPAVSNRSLDDSCVCDLDRGASASFSVAFLRLLRSIRFEGDLRGYRPLSRYFPESKFKLGV